MQQPLIWILDDDAQVRESLCWLLESIDLQVKAFSSPWEFLDIAVSSLDSRPGCLLLDVRMPGMTGLELLELLKEKELHLPVILLTGHADVAMAVRALKSGAYDFFEKPYNDQLLLEVINKAVAEHHKQLQEVEKKKSLELKLVSLTHRERQVLELLLEGLPGKQMADRLHISPKTVDVHRHHLIQKLGVKSLAEMVQLYSPLIHPS
ncbi:response regulator transcription factor [Marinospirillum sp.]|uniref:response regulator transcription factor n=1 Tax=Marinospirillum sp. TaxID=2183934 RepID=UPI0038511D6E